MIEVYNNFDLPEMLCNMVKELPEIYFKECITMESGVEAVMADIFFENEEVTIELWYKNDGLPTVSEISEKMYSNVYILVMSELKPENYRKVIKSMNSPEMFLVERQNDEIVRVKLK